MCVFIITFSQFDLWVNSNTDIFIFCFEIVNMTCNASKSKYISKQIDQQLYKYIMIYFCSFQCTC